MRNNAYQWWVIHSSWSFLRASTKAETKLVCCMISNVYIDLTQEKKIYIRYGSYTDFSHIKKTLICASQYPWLTYRECNHDFYWLGERLFVAMFQPFLVTFFLVANIPPPSTITPGVENAGCWLSQIPLNVWPSCGQWNLNKRMMGCSPSINKHQVWLYLSFS